MGSSSQPMCVSGLALLTPGDDTRLTVTTTLQQCQRPGHRCRPHGIWRREAPPATGILHSVDAGKPFLSMQCSHPVSTCPAYHSTVFLQNSASWLIVDSNETPGGLVCIDRRHSRGLCELRLRPPRPPVAVSLVLTVRRVADKSAIRRWRTCHLLPLRVL